MPQKVDYKLATPPLAGLKRANKTNAELPVFTFARNPLVRIYICMYATKQIPTKRVEGAVV